MIDCKEFLTVGKQALVQCKDDAILRSKTERTEGKIESTQTINNRELSFSFLL